MSDIMMHFFELHRKIVKNNRLEVESFDSYTLKRKGILNQLEIPKKYLDKIQKLFVLEYVIEFYIGEALSEKAMNSYYLYLSDNHKKMVESIIKSPENFRTIMKAISHKNTDFIFFLLECLYVIENNAVLNRSILTAFNKAKVDKYFVEKIITLNTSSVQNGYKIDFQIEMSEKDSRCMGLTLVLFLLTMNKANAISMSNFFCETGDQQKSLRLTVNVLKIFCQTKFKNMHLVTENLLDVLLGNFIILKNLGDHDQEKLQRERINFINRVINICFELQLYRSSYFFDLVNLFIKHKMFEFVTGIAIKIDLIKIFTENPRLLSKKDVCVMMTFLRILIDNDSISDQQINNVLHFVSFFKQKSENSRKTNNMVYSSILAFEKQYTEKYSICKWIEES